MEEGRIFGHENLGEVIEVGNVVVNIKVGDMVCMRFNIGCGHCKNCESGLTAFLTPSRSRFYKSSCDQLAFALQILIGELTLNRLVPLPYLLFAEPRQRKIDVE